MSPALRGTRGLFSILQQQDTLSRGDRERVRLNQEVHNVAADFTMLVDSLAEHTPPGRKNWSPRSPRLSVPAMPARRAWAVCAG